MHGYQAFSLEKGYVENVNRSINIPKYLVITTLHDTTQKLFPFEAEDIRLHLLAKKSRLNRHTASIL